MKARTKQKTHQLNSVVRLQLIVRKLLMLGGLLVTLIGIGWLVSELAGWS